MKAEIGEKFGLKLCPDKVSVKTLFSGMDFLGRVNFQDYRVLRMATKRRILKIIKNNPKPETLAAYLGLLRHGNTYLIRKELSA